MYFLVQFIGQLLIKSDVTKLPTVGVLNGRIIKLLTPFRITAAFLLTCTC